MIKIPTNNAVKARRIVDTAIDERVRLFEADRNHSMCHINTTLEKNLERLAIAKMMMHILIGRIPAEEINALSEQGKSPLQPSQTRPLACRR